MILVYNVCASNCMQNYLTKSCHCSWSHIVRMWFISCTYVKHVLCFISHYYLLRLFGLFSWQKYVSFKQSVYTVFANKYPFIVCETDICYDLCWGHVVSIVTKFQTVYNDHTIYTVLFPLWLWHKDWAYVMSTLIYPVMA